ncbi:MAG: shikimate dehydrogenase [Cytophagaceae bacterium]|nr:shikimate dehydrogenase [Cytophagaceae bacterium]
MVQTIYVQPTRLFGLIGFPLSHSFSKKYFTGKFEREGLADCRYELFELPDPTQFPALLQREPNLVGLNVTIPHKQALFPYLNSLDESAEKVGAVNVIRVLPDGTTRGYNSDFYGFKKSLETWEAFQRRRPGRALILGDGGAARAVEAALRDLSIAYQIVSRRAGRGDLTYADLTPEIIKTHPLLINTTPLGTYPDVDTCPEIPYHLLTSQHLLYDLVYNPAETQFLREGKTRGAATHNGYRMLELQAERSWEIWTTPLLVRT